MKVTLDGKSFFEVKTDDIPETINITKDTMWTDKWALFALCCLLSETPKINLETIQNLLEKQDE